ncbi:YtxH domain-containing protein [Allofustis seminis]|uniref:YtxH domain-containing protein n=1 Tax=Allofustis seminis TaxID=166939 RepID=UPI0003768EA4|nr:YtxH domain-containing protein [Allofustis seminis]
MKKVFTVTGMLVGGIIGATAAYYLAPKNGETYQKELKYTALKAEEKTYEWLVNLLNKTAAILDGNSDNLHQIKTKLPEIKITITKD